MSVLPVGFGSAVAGGYQIERSLRFNSVDSAYLNRTPASAGNRRTFTWSGWVKRSALSGSTRYFLFAAGSFAGSTNTSLNILNDSINIYWGGAGGPQWTATAVLRDPSAWYHLVFAFDTTQATFGNRLKLYVNGVQSTVWSLQETGGLTAQNSDLYINNNQQHNLGASGTPGNYFDGYMTEVNFIDGQALTPSDFGETDASTGVWKPKAYTGTYGTNGFYLPFKTASQWSGYFDGTGDYLSIPTSNSLMHQIGNWTYEGWIYWNSMPTTGYQNVFGQGAAGQSSFGLTVYNGSSWSAPYKFVINQANIGNRIVGTTTLVAGTWYHFAVVRNSGVITLYVNGTAEGTYSNSTDYAFGGNPFTIGNSSNGYISNFRFNRSAVYTSNFTPPTSQLTAITNTQLLTCQSSTFIDNSTNGFTVTAVGDSRPQQFSPFTLDVTDDHSGQGNHWQPNNLDLRTTGVGADIMVDSPTSYGTDTGVGGTVRGNYCTMNPLQYSSTYVTLSNGNLNVTGSSGADAGGAFATSRVNSGKWYWEATIVAVSGTYPFIGFAVNTSGTQYQGGARVNTSGTLAIASPESFITLNGSPSGTSFTTNDVLQFALDMDNGKMWIGKNGTWMNSGVPASGTGNVFSISDRTQFVSPYIFSYNSSQVAYNFGQRAFAYTAPSGFKALCTQNLPTPTIGATSTTQANDYFNTVIYTGTAPSTQAVTGVGFQPDFVWVKSRSLGVGSLVYDAVRGAGSSKALQSNSTDPEGLGVDVTAASSRGYISSFDSDGFTAADGTTSGQYSKANTSTYVSWNWKANGAGSSNTDGQITSTVSVNTTSKFSIVTYTGNGSANQTVGHGLGVAPTFGILKDRDANSNNSQWQVFHTGSGDNYAYLSTTAAFTGTAQFYPTTASSTTVTVGRDVAANTNESGDRFVMYLFADVDGYSKAFSYASNNTSDNAFVYLGFRPRWIMIKSESAGGTNLDWVIYDTARMTYNYIANTELRANLTTTEGGLARNPPIDILSNGFKVRTSSGEIGSSTLYVGMAFAETPFKYSLAR